MPIDFDLIVDADPDRLKAELSLLDSNGALVACQSVDFKSMPSNLHRFFDLRDHLRLNVERGKEAEEVREIGVCIAREILGEQIFDPLWRPEDPRTLRIRLRDTARNENHLATALARVPWEIARPGRGEETLGERGLRVRVADDTPSHFGPAMEPAPGEPLRVLFVFAGSRGSQPLNARMERQTLRRLFEQEIRPHRRVVAHFLGYGVTREQLEAQIQDDGGYHVLHWSGHGGRNGLELARPDGSPNRISGAGLIDIFAQPGVVVPSLIFLGACHSGGSPAVKVWDEFLALASGQEPAPTGGQRSPLDFSRLRGFDGTARSLLKGGVKSVVAMRYAVSDEYGRELAAAFYRALFARAGEMDVAAALLAARRFLLAQDDPAGSRFAVCDHATPLLFGAETPGLTVAPQEDGPPLLPPVNRRPWRERTPELDIAAHEHFVGRIWELAGLGANFIGAGTGTDVHPVAVIIGLGGIGKTALTAEALSLWEARFEQILPYQAKKPDPIDLTEMLRDVHHTLMAAPGRYRSHVEAHPADAIYPVEGGINIDPDGLARHADNLVRALKEEAVLLVLDNFEGNLEERPENISADGEPRWNCREPVWDRLLAALAHQLIGSRSRVLVSTRRPLAALANGPAYSVRVGPLPAEEAAHYVRQHPAMRRMIFDGDPNEKDLARRLLRVTRFHPLLMDRLARLAAGMEMREQLLPALDALEKTGNFSQLPALFAADSNDPRQIAYFEDALAASLDQLVQNAGPDARRLLWMVAIARDPLALGVVDDVWHRTESPRLAKLRVEKQEIDALPERAREERLAEIPFGLRPLFENFPPLGGNAPESKPLWRALIAVGLVNCMDARPGPDSDRWLIHCDEFARERIFRWMEEHPEDRGDWTAESVAARFAEIFDESFHTLSVHRQTANALLLGRRALGYFVRAGEIDRAIQLASFLATDTDDAGYLISLLPWMSAALESSPRGRPRWVLLTATADALRNADQPAASMPLYEDAERLAREGSSAPGRQGQQARSDLAKILIHMSFSLRDIGLVEESHRRQREGHELQPAASAGGRHESLTERLRRLKAGRLDSQTISPLTEAIELTRDLTRSWKAEAGDQNPLRAACAQTYAKDLAEASRFAAIIHMHEQQWANALPYLHSAIEILTLTEFPESDIAGFQVDRAAVLVQLRRFEEAQTDLNTSLAWLNNPSDRGRIYQNLALLYEALGDIKEAVVQQRRSLAILESTLEPRARASGHFALARLLQIGTAPAAEDEAKKHQLAALVYRIVARLEGEFLDSAREYGRQIAEARTAGEERPFPKLADLAADPHFRVVLEWLELMGAKLPQLQIQIDLVIDRFRKKVAEIAELPSRPDNA